MKQKLFTLFMLLTCAVMSAWADSVWDFSTYTEKMTTTQSSLNDLETTSGTEMILKYYAASGDCIDKKNNEYCFVLNGAPSTDKTSKAYTSRLFYLDITGSGTLTIVNQAKQNSKPSYILSATDATPSSESYTSVSAKGSEGADAYTYEIPITYNASTPRIYFAFPTKAYITSITWTPGEVEIIPTLSLTAPATTTDVAVDTKIVLTASEAVTKVGSTVTGKLNGTAIEFEFDAAAKTLTYTPASELENNTTYTVVVDADQLQNESGKKNAETTKTFKTVRAAAALTAESDRFWKVSDDDWAGDNNMELIGTFGTKRDVSRSGCGTYSDEGIEFTKESKISAGTTNVIHIKIAGMMQVTFYGYSNNSSSSTTANIYVGDMTGTPKTNSWSNSAGSKSTYQNNTTEPVDIYFCCTSKEWNFFGAKVEALPPTLVVDETATITATESGVEATTAISITGVQLTGSTLQASLSPEVEGLSVELASNTITGKAINTTATLKYTATTNAKGTTTLTITDGTTSKDVTVNYAANVAAWEQTTVSGATIWDIAGISGGADVTEADDIYANISGLTLPEGFDGTSLKVTSTSSNYAWRKSNNCAQGAKLSFKTSVAGIVAVTAVNPSSSSERYIKVTDNNQEVTGSIKVSTSSSNKTTELFIVDEGDVTISFTSSLRFFKIEFTPLPTTFKVNGSGYGTFSFATDVEIEGVDAYAATLDTDAKQITCTKIADNKVKAGTGVLLYGEANAAVTLKPAYNVEAPASNDLKGTTEAATGALVEKDAAKTQYSLSGSTFGTFTGSGFVANKAYFETDAPVTSKLDIVFNNDNEDDKNVAGGDNETTGLKAIDNSQFTIDNSQPMYNLAGQRVGKDYKGIVIVNGKKVVR